MIKFLICHLLDLPILTASSQCERVYVVILSSVCGVSKQFLSVMHHS